MSVTGSFTFATFISILYDFTFLFPCFKLYHCSLDMQLLKRYILILLKAAIAFLAIMVLNYSVIALSTMNAITTNEKELIAYHHVLIPGAGNSPLGEWQNPTFSGRMNACVALYQKNKISKIVCSGIVKPPYYNEPADMKDFLIRKKIPAEIIFLDNLGHNTRQTVYNYAAANEADSVVIISQRLHLSRAVFAARFYGLNAKGFSVGKYERFQNEFIIYEALSRMKLTYELLFK